MIAVATLGLTVPAGSSSAAYRCKNIDSFRVEAAKHGLGPGLVRDLAGNFYGTSAAGGTILGNVIKLTPPQPGKTAWKQETVYTLRGNDGCNPGQLTIDASGNLFGVTTSGGDPTNANHCVGPGVVFELSPPQAGSSSWTYSVLHRFPGEHNLADGSDPWPSRLLLDPSGNLYGTTTTGGVAFKRGLNGVDEAAVCGSTTDPTGVGCGTVYELSPPASGSSLWTETILYRFTGSGFSDPNFGSVYDTGDPRGGLVTDGRGDLYGTTWDTNRNAQGQDWAGTVFEVSPPTGTGATWTETVLFGFDGMTDGGLPLGTPLLAASGNIFVTVSEDYGQVGGCGGVVELTASGAGGISATPIYGFNQPRQSKGCFPTGGLVEDAAGKLYGTTTSGGPLSDGTVFSLAPPAPGSTGWTFAILQALGAPVGAGSCGGGDDPDYEELLLDGSGNVFGTAGDVAFELVPH